VIKLVNVIYLCGLGLVTLTPTCMGDLLVWPHRLGSLRVWHAGLPIQLPTCLSYVLNPSQIIRRFDFSRYIAFTIYLDIAYVYVHNKCNIFRKAKTYYNLERMASILHFSSFRDEHVPLSSSVLCCVGRPPSYPLHSRLGTWCMQCYLLLFY
jgi:hypothetical protein